jgi:membrane-associated protease RseP (regulator of RpoE activity)
MLATALNLFPIGQLDGGHISYSVFGPRSTYVTFLTMGAAIVLSYRSSGLMVWTVAMIVMLFVFGPRHPRVLDEDVPLDRRRMALAIFALVMFVLCFTPVPISVIGR